jgi:hypothetical protein
MPTEVSPEGQKAIADYKINGEQLFYPNANDPNAGSEAARQSPSAPPRLPHSGSPAVRCLP